MKLTDYLAVYAAILSTVAFFWNALNARSRIRVRILPGSDTKDGKFVSGLYISIQNISAHEVHLSGLNVLYPFERVSLFGRIRHLFKYRRWPTNIGWVHTTLDLFAVSDGLPTSVESRASHNILVPDEAMRSLLKDAIRKEVRVQVQDQLWRRSRSAILKVTWLKTPNKALERSREG